MQKLIQGLDMNYPGLEIGPLDKPIVGRQPPQRVWHVDRASTDDLKTYFKEVSGVTWQAIAEVDYVWDGPASSLSQVVDGRQFGWAIASHVMEHVPDLAGWLVALGDVLMPGALFNLAVPDQRYTFDCKRELSTLDQVVRAYQQQLVQPSAEQMWDFLSKYTLAAHAGYLWSGAQHPQLLQPTNSDDKATEIMHKAQSEGSYLDTHCWTFTPASFLELIDRLQTLGMCPFDIAHFEQTQLGGFEFFVRLRRH